jgi:hypothetical protein
MPGYSCVIAHRCEIPEYDTDNAEDLAYHALPYAVCGCNAYDDEDDDIQRVNGRLLLFEKVSRYYTA